MLSPQNIQNSRGFVFGADYVGDSGIKQLGLYEPDTNFYCKLPDPSGYNYRFRSSMVGLTNCGYSGLPNQPTCVVFNTNSGVWEDSFNYPFSIYGHVTWRTSQGILLMGGYKNLSYFSNPTTLLLPDGTYRDSFDLKDKGLLNACGVEDFRAGNIILTGGVFPSSTNTGGSTNNVTRYGENGFIEDLPKLIDRRSRHGCAGFYNNEDKLVGYLKRFNLCSFFKCRVFRFFLWLVGLFLMVSEARKRLSLDKNLLGLK